MKWDYYHPHLSHQETKTQNGLGTQLMRGRATIRLDLDSHVLSHYV